MEAPSRAGIARCECKITSCHLERAQKGAGTRGCKAAGTAGKTARPAPRGVEWLRGLGKGVRRAGRNDGVWEHGPLERGNTPRGG